MKLEQKEKQLNWLDEKMKIMENGVEFGNLDKKLDNFEEMSTNEYVIKKMTNIKKLENLLREEEKEFQKK